MKKIPRSSCKWTIIGFLTCCSATFTTNAASITCIEPNKESGASGAVIVEDVPLIYTSQLFPVDAHGHVLAEGDAAKQAGHVLTNMGAVLRACGSDISRTAKLNIYLNPSVDISLIQKSLAQQFSGPVQPAVSYVAGQLTIPGALVAMDAVAVADATAATKARTVQSLPLPAEHAKRGSAAALLPAGPKVYVSGMADTNHLTLATRKTLEKLLGTIGHLGLGKTDIVQLKAFLQPISEVEAVRKEMSAFFDGKPPPLVFVEWISNPPNPPIEIELIAAAKSSQTNQTDAVTFLTPPGTTSTKVYSRVARVNHGKQIFVSGLYGLKSADSAGQVREIFDTLKRLVESAGGNFEHLAKATYYVSTDDASTRLNDIRPQLFNPLRPPAASKAKVKSVGLPDKSITLDMIAVPAPRPKF